MAAESIVGHVKIAIENNSLLAMKYMGFTDCFIDICHSTQLFMLHYNVRYKVKTCSSI